jgi:uncharacterized protein YbjT (DUF2867 family)
MRIVVAGATGTVGRHIMTAARARGHESVAVTRANGVDVIAGGPPLDEAVAGADALIDVTSVATMDADVSTAFFRAAATNLLASAHRAGVGHVVLLSIVGIDLNPHGYYAGKLAQEAVYAQSPQPWTTVRATQFHEFAAQVAPQAKLGPVQLAPRARVQPVAAGAVAEHLVTLAEGMPQRRATDIAGPREEQLSAMIRAWVRHRGGRGPVLAVNVPGAQMRGMRRGLALPHADARLMGPTFADWLAQLR